MHISSPFAHPDRPKAIPWRPVSGGRPISQRPALPGSRRQAAPPHNQRPKRRITGVTLPVSQHSPIVQPAAARSWPSHKPSLRRARPCSQANAAASILTHSLFPCLPPPFSCLFVCIFSRLSNFLPFSYLFACPSSHPSNFPRFFQHANRRLETKTISRRIALRRYLISGLEETKVHKSCTNRRQSPHEQNRK